MPVQRLPRYTLLLSNLLKYTDEKCPDSEMVTLAMTELEKLISYVNEQKREVDSWSRMQKVSPKIKGKKKGYFFRQSRILLREGILQVVNTKKGKEKKIYLFLFNDMLIFSKQMGGELAGKKKGSTRYISKTNIPLESSFLENVDPIDVKTNVGAKDLYFRFTNKNGVQYLWKAQNPLDKKGWMTDIQKALDKLKLKEEIN